MVKQKVVVPIQKKVEKYRITVDYEKQVLHEDGTPELDDAGKPIFRCLSCVISKPGMAIMEQAMGFMIPGHNYKLATAGEIVLRAGWEEGDDEILEDEEILMSAALKCVELLKVRSATLEKL